MRLRAQALRMLNRENLDLLSFFLAESARVPLTKFAGVRCEACTCFVPSELSLHVGIDGSRACSPQCAAELGHLLGDEVDGVDEDMLEPRRRRRDVASRFATAGMK